MTTTATHPSTVHTPAHPLVAGPVGTLVFAAAMAVGEVFELNADPGGDTDGNASEWLVTGGLAVLGLAIAIGLAMRAWQGDPARLAKYSLGLAIAGAVTFVAFWSGWPSAFSAVAFGLALEHRRRIGSFATGTGIAAALGALTFLATAYICVTG